MAWTVRYRFIVSHPLTIDAPELTLDVGGRKGVLSGDGGRPLKDCNWLTLNFHDLEDENSARQFGHQISRAVFLTGVRLGIGIDAGNNRARGGVGKIVADMVATQGGKVMPNVHGLLIYEREGNELFFGASANATVSIDPSAFVDQLTVSFHESSELGEREQTALTLIALSKTAGDPLAEAALCISAVEFLSIDVPWTSAQLDLLTILKTQAATSTQLPVAEAKEVADAIERVFKSIRQSVKRKIIALGLPKADWKLFDDVYVLRSGIFHGSVIGRERHTELASKAREICARIVMAAVEKAHVDDGMK